MRSICDSGITLNGNLNVNDENDPPIAATIMDLPPGPCSVELIASDDQGVALCTGSTDFTVVANTTVNANVVLVCGDEPETDPLGNVDITGTFEFIDGNRCPRLHFLNAVPDEVPAEGSEVTVLVSDADGDTLTTALTATGGSFADPGAQPTTYFCDGATGGQTISVTVSDGDAACDKSKSFDVTCPGVNLCEGVVCEDDGNVCTDAECNPATGRVRNLERRQRVRSEAAEANWPSTAISKPVISMVGRSSVLKTMGPVRLRRQRLTAEHIRVIWLPVFLKVVQRLSHSSRTPTSASGR